MIAVGDDADLGDGEQQRLGERSRARLPEAASAIECGETASWRACHHFRCSLIDCHPIGEAGRKPSRPLVGLDTRHPLAFDGPCTAGPTCRRASREENNNETRGKTARRCGILASTAFAAAAQTYPDRTITVVVPFAAGGPTDTVTRLVAEAMSKDLGQQIIVENVGGAGGTLGAGRVASAEPDGYTLLLAPHRHGDQRDALPQARLRHAERLRICRAGHRGADDHRRPQGSRADRPQGPGRIRQGQQGHGDASPMPASVLPRICAACCS